MSNFNRIAEWLQKCGKGTSTADMSVQLGVHMEEFAELLREVTLESMTGLSAMAMQEVGAVLDAIGANLKSGAVTAIVYDRAAFLDALCDIDVTANAVAYCAGMDKAGADDEVYRSLMSKFDSDGNPVILPGGKIGKSSNYTPPELEPFIGKPDQADQSDRHIDASEDVMPVAPVTDGGWMTHWAIDMATGMPYGLGHNPIDVVLDIGWSNKRIVTGVSPRIINWEAEHHQVKPLAWRLSPITVAAGNDGGAA